MDTNETLKCRIACLQKQILRQMNDRIKYLEKENRRVSDEYETEIDKDTNLRKLYTKHLDALIEVANYNYQDFNQDAIDMSNIAQRALNNA